MKQLRVLTAALFAAVLLCGFSATAYAGGGEEFMDGTGGYDPDPLWQRNPSRSRTRLPRRAPGRW